MSLITWIALGLMTGLVASRLVRPHQGPTPDITLGILGALVAGGLAHALGASSGVSLANLVFALLGACVVLAVYHWLARRTAWRWFTRRTAWDRPTASFVEFGGTYGRLWRHTSPVTPKIRVRSRS